MSATALRQSRRPASEPCRLSSDPPVGPANPALATTVLRVVHSATFGLRSEVGHIVLLQNRPAESSAIDVKDRERSEVETFGATHADIGWFVATL